MACATSFKHVLPLTFQTEERLDDLDVKIGLLIKNMIELDDVVDQAKSMSDMHEKGNKTEQNSGLKALKKVGAALFGNVIFAATAHEAQRRPASPFSLGRTPAP